MFEVDMRLALLAVFVLLSFSAVALPSKILIVESYHADYPWDMSYISGIKSVVSPTATFTHFRMDTKRRPKKQHAERAELAWQYYLEIQPDLVVLGDDNAIALLSQRLALTNTPVIFLGLNSNPRDLGLTQFKNFTGVLERPIFRRSIMLVEQLLPTVQSRKILVLFDNSRTSQEAVQQISVKAAPLTIGNNKVYFKLIDHFEQWQEQINGIKSQGYNALFIGLYHTLRNASDDHIKPEEVISWTSKNSPIPHFGFWDFSIRSEGNVGGYVLDGFLHGQLAGELIRQVLSGKQPADLPYQFDRKGQYLFSIDGVNRWDLKIPEEIKANSSWTK